MLTLEELKRLHDTAYTSHQETRERAADDQVFYWVTHWGDSFSQTLPEEYRGEFDLLRKGGRAIMADLASNPIQNDFAPRTDDDESEELSDLADGMYRAGTNHNTSIEAFSNSRQETVVCGFGAWELRTEYETDRRGNNNQIIRRYPIWEANNNAYCDPNARLLDKSDADFWSILAPYTDDGYIKLVKELTGEDIDSVDAGSFKTPEISYSFPWIGGESKKIYVTTFYHRKLTKVTLYTLDNGLGEEIYMEGDEYKEFMDGSDSDGFEVVDEKEIERYEVRKYIASGAEILNGEMGDDGERIGEVIAGPNLPVIPQYGEHTYIEGEEHYEGVTRLAKDPVRLHDAAMSYLGDIFSKSPGQKPVLTKDQIAGLEAFWERGGFGNDLPYALINSVGEHNQQLSPVIGLTPDTPVPQALVATLAQSRQGVTDVVGNETSGEIADTDLSGKAILALQARLDLQSVIYQEHGKHSLRRDGEVWAGMASVIYDTPRKVKVEHPDGTKKTQQLMELVIGDDGVFKTKFDLRNLEFDVYSKISASYSSQKEQTLDRMEKLLTKQMPGTPMAKMLELKIMLLMDGVEFDDMQEYAKKELMIMGVRQPETPEEEQMLAEEQKKQQPPSADMVLAQAEMVKGEAAKERNQIDAMKAQSGAQSAEFKNMIGQFEAVTKRMSAQIDAQEAGATINNKNIDAFGKQIDNQIKVRELRKPENMTEDELIEQILAG